MSHPGTTRPMPDMTRRKPVPPGKRLARIALYSTLGFLALFFLMPQAVILPNSLRFNGDIPRESFIAWRSA